MATKSPKAPIEEPDRFLKIIQFQSWFFLIVLIIDVLVVMIVSIANRNGLFGSLSTETLVIGILCMIGAGLSFGLNYQIQTNPERKKNLFITYFVSIALVGMIAVFVLSAYQW